ncbi:MAG: metallophosphoesterase family protein, partial [Candidatus Subteraquimicrobiales bacterium]|nr:metallophosphoesterase family protein [Candidatus Subteraquimicrobiales bacterium]
MKAGVLSDTHVKTEKELSRLNEIINTYFNDVDLVLHAGDYVSPDVLDLLTSFSKTYAVCGNMDPPELSAILPIKRTVEIKFFKIGLIHGWGPPFGLIERVKKEFIGVDCIVFGHSHQPLNEIIDG